MFYCVCWLRTVSGACITLGGVFYCLADAPSGFCGRFVLFRLLSFDF